MRTTSRLAQVFCFDSMYCLYVFHSLKYVMMLFYKSDRRIIYSDMLTSLIGPGVMKDQITS